jgi:hypothetical protein
LVGNDTRALSWIERVKRVCVAGDRRHPASRAYWVVLLTLACSPAAFGYTDPGSGALLWQILAAGFIGLGFYFRRLLGWARRVCGGKSGAADIR